jgi:CheY-like chemotaxis protein/anti-sigma regulatory factor (Ser/Thr protein kinase)
VRQVLINLLSNAVKYNRRGGLVRVHLGCDGHHARLEVADNGLGMDAAQLARLFQPFERLGREHSGIEGMGVGLSIVKRLVTLMDGHLSVSSRPGEGTAFVVELPQAEPPAGDELRTPAWVSTEHGIDTQDVSSVLSVDDDAVSGLVVVEMLRRLRPHWQLRTAASVAEALAALRAAPVDWLLLDLNLPDGSGLELLAQARERGLLAQTRVVLCSADGQMHTRQAALDAGVQERLDKPVRLAQIRRLLAEAPAAQAD